MKARVAAAIAGLVMAGLCSCTSHIADSPFIKSSLVEQDYAGALERIEKISRGSSGLLYFYEKGTVLHFEGLYEESNQAFGAAEFLYEDLYTKSVARQLGSFVTSDNLIAYRGEPYEAALIHYYKIMNYLYIEDWDGALVECRKLNHRLQMFADLEDEFYVNDPFLQYLTGMVYLALGEYNEANVSLRVALAAFENLRDRYRVDIPGSLYCDLAESAEALFDYQEADSFHKRGCVAAGGRQGSGGRLNLFLEFGYAPYRTEQNVVIPLYADEIEEGMDVDEYAETLAWRYGEPRHKKRKVKYLLRVAIPELVVEPPLYHGARVRASMGEGSVDAAVVEAGFPEAGAVMVENLQAVVSESFERRRFGILVKTILRNLAKYFAKEGVEDETGAVGGFLVNLFNVATETADTRSWTTLPQSIWMSRLELPAGTYDIEVDLIDRAGGPAETLVFPDVRITAGQATFLNYRVF